MFNPQVVGDPFCGACSLCGMCVSCPPHGVDVLANVLLSSLSSMLP